MGLFGNYKKSVEDLAPGLVKKHFDIPLMIKRVKYDKMIFDMKLYQLKAKYESDPMLSILYTVLSASCGVQSAIILSQPSIRSPRRFSKGSIQYKEVLAIVGENLGDEIIIKR